VATAEDGREALTMAKEKEFDLIFLDVNMPEMDGYAVLENLRADMRLRNIPVIMISAVEVIYSVVKCIELGAEDYLPKPFNPVLLRARVSASLEKKAMRDREASFLNEIKERKKDPTNC
jgi:adenylate cyclase